MVTYISNFAIAEGLQVCRKQMEKCGVFLTIEINPGAPKACLFQAHMDTVHEKGVFGTPPIQVCDDRIIGPGVIDCKGGIAIALLTMKTLLDAGYQNHIRLILTSDEEISNILGGAEEIASSKTALPVSPVPSIVRPQKTTRSSSHAKVS